MLRVVCFGALVEHGLKEIKEEHVDSKQRNHPNHNDHNNLKTWESCQQFESNVFTSFKLTLITVVFLFSYLHSHRGQNSCSLPLIFSANFGRITESQLLQKQWFWWLSWITNRKTANYHLFGGTLSITRILLLSSCVLFMTELMLGQMHLQRLSSYEFWAWKISKTMRNINFVITV